MRSRRRESQTRRKIWRKDVQRIPCFLPEDQRCCQLAWLAHGWSCKVCGASSRSGSYWAARGIYGGRFLTSTPPWWCECGSELGNNKNMSSCGSCWWLCTVQLVCWLMELLGPWSEIHDNIWTCLVEVPHWGYGLLEADRSRQIVLAEVREYGRIAETIPGLCKILSGHV